MLIESLAGTFSFGKKDDRLNQFLDLLYPLLRFAVKLRDHHLLMATQAQLFPRRVLVCRQAFPRVTCIPNLAVPECFPGLLMQPYLQIPHGFTFLMAQIHQVHFHRDCQGLQRMEVHFHRDCQGLQRMEACRLSSHARSLLLEISPES